MSRRPVSTDRRAAAALALTLYAAATLFALVAAVSAFPRGLIVASGFVGGAVAILAGLLRRGRGRGLLVLGGLVVLLVALVLFARGQVLAEVVAAGVLVALGSAAAHRATRRRAHLPHVPRPQHPVMVWNPRSGGGKALKPDLAGEARARGITPIELQPGDDLVALVEAAVADGADALAAAGGDGTQAIVATIASQHDLPFACIPAGTRNHFALDLGVDRDDLVGSLEAFVDGRERVVDLGEVNGQVFVNNVSLGVYAEAVQQEGYRDAKLQTLLGTLPSSFAPGGDETHELRWHDAQGVEHRAATVLLVSNNPYRLGSLLGSGTRPRLDTGELGILAMGPVPVPGTASGPSLSPPITQWSTPTFEVDASGDVPAGIDGEAVRLTAPVRFGMRPAALRVRVAQDHPGASPSAGLPPSPRGALHAMVRVARGIELP
jgi:diacylglycerol kinase family enzyme